MSRHAEILADVRRGGHQLAFLGDSITESWSTDGKPEWDRVWRGRHAVNCGVSGDRTQHLLGRLDDGLLDALSAPNNSIRAVVLLIGTNNLRQSSNPEIDTPEDVAVGVQRIVDRLHSRLPGARVVLAGVLPRDRFDGPIRRSIERLNQLLRGAALREPGRVSFVDAGSRFIGAGREIPGALMPDFLHLSAEGYGLLGAELELALGD